MTARIKREKYAGTDDVPSAEQDLGPLVPIQDVVTGFRAKIHLAEWDAYTDAQRAQYRRLDLREHVVDVDGVTDSTPSAD